MKKIKTLLIAISAIAIFVSCSKPDQHLNTIPVSAEFVGSVDLLSIAKKAELYDMEQYGFYKDAMKKLEQENPEMHAMVMEMTSNPLGTGIKYREDMYFFFDNISNNDPFVGMTMSLRDAKDFGAFIKKAVETSKAGVEVKEKEGMNYLFANGMMIIYDNMKMLSVIKNGSGEDEVFEYAKGLMMQDAETSIVSHSDFASFKADQKDLNLWVAYGGLMNNPQTAMITSQLPFKLDNIFAHVYMEFKDNGIFGTTKMSLNDEMKKMFGEYQFMKPGFNEKLLAYFPQENYITYGLALNPSGIYKWINDIPSYKQMIDQVNNSSPFSIEEMINSLGGDIMIAVHGFQVPEQETTEEPAHSVELSVYATAVMSMNDDKTYKQLTPMIPPGMFELNDGVYSGNFQGTDVFFGLFDNNLIVTTDKKVIEAAKDGGLKENLAGTDLKDIFTKISFVYMNLDMETYPDDVKDMIEKNMEKPELGIFKAITDKTVEMKMYSDEVNDGKFEFVMKNTDGNSLHTILKLIDEIQNCEKESHEMADVTE
jgi:hypothetical protein